MKRIIFLLVLVFFLGACGEAPKHAQKVDKHKKHSTSKGGDSSLDDVIYDSLGHKKNSGIRYTKSTFQDTSFDIPITYNDRVQKWIDYFTGKGYEHFARYLSRSGRMIPYMQAVLKQNGVPKDIVYLSMIESGFNTRAQSWASAAGPWQFIRSTGAMYGLNGDYYVDERRDVEKSTLAAARHLRDLYDQFGDWYLAFAAYNAGAGKVRGAIARNGTNYWDMCEGSYLRQETKDYVPKIIAAAIISKNPAKYGFTNVEYQVPIDYEKVQVPSPTDLEVAANCAGVDPELIRLLNPELLHDLTPPNDSNYELKIPRGTKNRFTHKYASMSPSQRMGATEYVVDKGDSLSGICSRYGASERDIVAANSGKIETYQVKDTQRVAVRGKHGRVKYRNQTVTVARYRVDPGTKLIIPKNHSIDYTVSSRDDAAAHAAKDEFGVKIAKADDEATDKKDKKNKKKDKKKQEVAKEEPTTELAKVINGGVDSKTPPPREDLVATAVNTKSDLDPTIYDHLDGSSPRKNINNDTPMAFNHQPEGAVSADQVPPAPSDAQLKEIVEKNSAVSDDLALDNRGDTAAPAASNQKEPLVAEASAKDKAPAAHSASDLVEDKPTYHVVKNGETLSNIADHYGVTVAELKKWNGKKVTPFPKKGVKIQVGEGKTNTKTNITAKEKATAAQYAKSSNQKPEAKKVASKQNSKKAQSKTVHYKVKPGDNLTTIAKKHSTTPQQIAKLNGLKNQKVLLGAILIVEQK